MARRRIPAKRNDVTAVVDEMLLGIMQAPQLAKALIRAAAKRPMCTVKGQFGRVKAHTVA